MLHGGLSDVDQQRIVEDFGKSKAKIRLLLASDVASEGLNLHYLCHRLVHFDMPWSLMVFQQRNGRVDRYGQSTSPEIVYLQTDARNERVRGDTRILSVLREKSEQAFENIGDPSAFMGVFDVEEEELVTARAMEAGTSPEELSNTLDANLLDRLRRQAEKHGLSLNAFVRQLLARSVGLQPGVETYDDLDDLAGTWSPRQVHAFEQHTQPFREVDPELWE